MFFLSQLQKELPMSKRITLLVAIVFALAAGSAFAADQIRGPFAGAVHAVGSLTDKSGNPINVIWDRGKITSLSDSSITLTRRDKAQVSFAITSDTAVRNDGATYHLSDLKTGLVATVVSQGGTAEVIRNIRGEGAPSGADQSEFEGPAAKAITGSVAATYYDGTSQTFDYNRGRIQSVGNGQLTIMRADKQSVSFTYDSSTLVREGDGKVGSVDDLKVGEGAMFFSQGGLLKLVRCVHDAPSPQAAGSRAAQPALAPAK
jgi:Domain of unknown function (DUF5666)